MARNVSAGSMEERPFSLQTAKSFTRFESSAPALFGRSRAKTVQASSPAASKVDKKGSPSPEEISKAQSGDVFEGRPSLDEGSSSPELSRTPSLLDRFDELPIELVSLTDRLVRIAHGGPVLANKRH